ncbi:hypothetical protein BDY19DRAFT_965680 [Irpex rosettiformis]|uniref:Uncharacterized protein n=1 Tax=Irpex rosettiformis TaxID=378272 RepID=A0ACB8TUB8_9APHY|nr:hypothetical protein BDY19DRAFT_965680 [Irpex rosettiformis]
MATTAAQSNISNDNGPEVKHDEWDCALDDKFYDPDPEALGFYKKETGIEDDGELKQHILRVQREAFAIYNYPCIRVFEFMRLKLARLPAYEHVVNLGRQKNKIFIDLGCCFGNDSRKLVQDGYPAENIIASDIRKGLWEMGHKLFRSTSQSFPVHFIEGNIFDPQFIATTPPIATSTAVSPELLPAINSLTSLNSLQGRVSGVFTGAFFHLFDEDQQYQIAKSLAGLLSPEPGSILIGVQGGMKEKGFWQAEGSEYKMFCHSPESWAKMWHGIFSDGNEGDGGIEVTASLRKEIGGTTFFGTYPKNTRPYYVMEWSVVRK